MTFHVMVSQPGCLAEYHTSGIASVEEAAEAWVEEVQVSAANMPRPNEDAVLAQIEQDLPQVLDALRAGRSWTLRVDGYDHEVGPEPEDAS